jgi:hypothetical protein
MEGFFNRLAPNPKFAGGQTKSSVSCILCDIAHARLASEHLGQPSEGCATLLLGALVAEVVGDMQVAGRLPHRPLPAPVVADRGRGSERTPVSCQLLYGSEVGRVVAQPVVAGLF